MLNYLRIRNLALIDEVTLEIGPGLSVFTGETGAGKSILLGGLALLSGERASLSSLRAEADSAVIEGVFDLRGRADVSRTLAGEGLAGEGGEMLVRRTLTPAMSRAYLNDRLVTLRVLRGVGERLVEIASQHESQGLVHASEQLELLDRSADLLPLRGRVEEAHAAAAELAERLDALRTDDRERAQRADYLSFQVQEIRAAELSAEEEAQLAAERQRLRHAEEIAAATAEALDLLYEGEGSVTELIGRASGCLERIARLDPASGLAGAALDEARFTVDELARQLQPYRDAARADPGRLAVIEERLAVIDGLRRKYGDSVAEILARADRAERELDALQHRDQDIEQVTQELRDAGRAYDAEATALSQARQLAAGSLQKVISATLRELGMEGARLAIRLRPRNGGGDTALPPGAGRSGYESVEFQLAANPGEPFLPLSRVASGGELSRVMLALKVAEVQGATAQTLVFDEIDAGVGGGRVAERLAELLEQLAAHHQVLVVTHLPQIAARASTHFRVSKSQQDGRNRVHVECLEAEQRVAELSRMLGGVETTESVRAHARNLLGRA